MWLVEGASNAPIGLNSFTSKGINIYLSYESIKLVSQDETDLFISDS